MRTNFAAYFRQFAGLPNTIYHETPEQTWFVTPGAPGSFLLAITLDPATAQAQIEAMMAQWHSHGRVMLWLVAPDCQPPDLPSLLERLGLYANPGDQWMLADLAQRPLSLPSLPTFTVRLVTTPAELRLWRDLSQDGFQATPAIAQIYHDAYAQHPLTPTAPSHHYIGYAGAEPVTSGTLLLAEGMAGVYDLSTPPQFRRQGYGRALLAHMMAVAQQAGYDHAWLAASAMGVALYEQMGFVRQYQPQAFVWRPSAK